MVNFKQDLFDFNDNEEVKNDNLYTKKMSVPQYTPSDTKPMLHSIYNKDKYNELLNEINASNVSEEEKNFLRLAATRHIVFNYSKIADYYAHSDAEMQKLMEHSALVLIDINDAIANGYVEFSSRIEKILKSEYDKE